MAAAIADIARLAILAISTDDATLMAITTNRGVRAATAAAASVAMSIDFETADRIMDDMRSAPFNWIAAAFDARDMAAAGNVINTRNARIALTDTDIMGDAEIDVETRRDDDALPVAEPKILLDDPIKVMSLDAADADMLIAARVTNAADDVAPTASDWRNARDAEMDDAIDENIRANLEDDFCSATTAAGDTVMNLSADEDCVVLARTSGASAFPALDS